jgi:hypothetical protein
LSEGLDQIRSEVAADRGLPADAVSFMTGGTLAEVEASADALVHLLGTSHDEPAQEPTTDPFATARAAKAERQRALLAAFTGRSEPTRDAAGRYARSGFDGGARSPIPSRADPRHEHDELIVRLAARSKLGRSDPF